MVWSPNLVLGLYLLGVSSDFTTQTNETTYFGVSVYLNLATVGLGFTDINR